MTAVEEREVPAWLTRSRRKARLNELVFRDAEGDTVKNNWHHIEWFDQAEKHDRLIPEW